MLGPDWQSGNVGSLGHSNQGLPPSVRDRGGKAIPEKDFRLLNTLECVLGMQSWPWRFLEFAETN